MTTARALQEMRHTRRITRTRRQMAQLRRERMPAAVGRPLTAR